MAAGKQVVLCPSIESFVTNAGDLYLLPAPDLKQKFVSAPHGATVLSVLRQMEALDWDEHPDRAFDGLDEHQREIALAAIEQLVEIEYVRPREQAMSQDASLRPYDRQMRYLAQCGLVADAAQRSIRDTRVLVVGLGGLGGAVAESLLRMGVGMLVGVDFDVIEAENLHRQSLYTRADVGRPKAHAALPQLQRCNPEADVRVINRKIKSADDLRALFDEVQPTVVVSAADYPPITFKHWMDEAAFERGLPVIFGGHRPPFVYVGPFLVPGRSPCFRCFKWNPDRDLRPALTDELDAARDEHGFIVPGLGFLDQAVAGFLVSDLFAFITGSSEPELIRHEIQIDVRTYASEPIEFGRSGCAHCNGIEERRVA